MPRSHFVAFLLLSPVLPADTLTGTVVKIVDGDTVYILDTNKTQHKIRLAGIDAPERRQAFGTKSKEYLRDLVAGEAIDVEWHKRDRWKRIVGKIIHAGSDVNLAMVNAGYAWWYRTPTNNRWQTRCSMKPRKIAREQHAQAYGTTRIQYRPGSGAGGER